MIKVTFYIHSWNTFNIITILKFKLSRFELILYLKDSGTN